MRYQPILMVECEFFCIQERPEKIAKGILAVLATAKDDPKQRREIIEDVYWSILSSKEFLFNR